MDGSNPQIIELEKDFEKLDQDGDSYITESEMKAYLQAKAIPFQIYLLKEIFTKSNNKKIACSDFVSYVLSCRIKSDWLAVAKYHIERHMEEHADANPPEVIKEIKSSFAKFSINDKPGDSQHPKQSVRIQCGVDKVNENHYRKLLKNLFDREVAGVYFLLKIEVKANGEEIATALETSINQLKQIAKQLDEDLGSLLEMFQVSARFHQGYVYGILQLTDLFLEQFAQTLDQLVVRNSPFCQAKLHAELQSTMFDTILSKGLNKEVKEAALTVGLDIDTTSLNKLKKIINKQAKNPASVMAESRIALLFITLLQEVQFESNFKNSSQFYENSGLKENELDIKQLFQFIKNYQIKETLEGFCPGILQLINLLRENAGSFAEVSLHIRDIIVKVQKELVIEGFFDLIL